MPEFEPVLLARVGKPDSQSLETYRRDGGYEGFKKALGMAPVDVINLVKDSGLRGRGGAGFPTGLKWTFLPKDHPGPIYLAINADESEPATFNNRILMEEDPHQILEGIAISCKVGCLGLGTAAVTVIDDQTSMVDVLFNCARFFAHESCGQCTPCREGTAWMHKILTRIRMGQGELRDLDLLTEVAGSMGIIPGTTICGLSDGAAWPIKNAIKKFRPEFEEYIKTGLKTVKPSEALMAAH